MHHAIAVKMANGEEWTLSGNQRFLRTLEEISGFPAFAYLADSRDMSVSRIQDIVFAASASFRRAVGHQIRSLDSFVDEDLLPQYASDEWFEFSSKISGWIADCFPQAATLGAPLVAAIQQMRSSGPQALLDTLPRSRSDEPTAESDTPISVTA